MIRINFLEPGAGAAEAETALAPPADASFLSRREAWFGAFLLVAAVALLTAAFWEPAVEEPAPKTAALEAPPQPVAPPEPPPAAVAEPEEPPAETGQAPAEAEPRAAPPAPPAAKVAPPADPAPAGDGAAVAGVAFVPAEDDLEIRFAVRGDFRTNLFRLDNPNRLVVDFEPARLEIASESRTQEIAHPLAERLRIAQNALEPPRVRCVIEVEAFPETSVNRAPESVTLLLRAPDGDQSQSQARAASEAAPGAGR